MSRGVFDSIFPIPPLEPFRIASIVRVVHGASEYVEQTAILRGAGFFVRSRIEPLRIFAFEIRDSPYADVIQIRGNRRPNAGNGGEGVFGSTGFHAREG